MSRKIPSDIMAVQESDLNLIRVRRKYGVDSPQFCAAKVKVDTAYQVVDNRLQSELGAKHHA